MYQSFVKYFKFSLKNFNIEGKRNLVSLWLNEQALSKKAIEDNILMFL